MIGMARGEGLLEKANDPCLTKHQNSTILSLLNIVTKMQSRIIRRQKNIIRRRSHFSKNNLAFLIS